MNAVKLFIMYVFETDDWEHPLKIFTKDGCHFQTIVTRDETITKHDDTQSVAVQLLDMAWAGLNHQLLVPPMLSCWPF